MKAQTLVKRRGLAIGKQVALVEAEAEKQAPWRGGLAGGTSLRRRTTNPATARISADHSDDSDVYSPCALVALLGHTETLTGNYTATPGNVAHLGAYVNHLIYVYSKTPVQTRLRICSAGSTISVE